MTEYIVDLSEVEKTSDRFKMLFTESIPLGREIVRCRDCKWCMAYAQATYCDRFAHELPEITLDGFCAWAVKRVDE